MAEQDPTTTRAVCQVCPWEGVEVQAPRGVCPLCGDDTVCFFWEVA